MPEPSSPKRRHILSSINRDDEPRPSSRKVDEREPKQDLAPSPTAEPPAEPKERKSSGRFRLKSKKHSRSHHGSSRHGERKRGREDDDDGSSAPRRHRRRHASQHHGRRRHRSRSPTPPNPHDDPPLDPDAAFRESLFDAMADDEGAAYWEGVYGQPIHVYSDARPGQQGELDQMTSDEYCAYVRQKMWEKTHQGLLEERARREELRRDKEKRREQSHRETRKMEDEAARIEREMEESLRRGEKRRRKKDWEIRWDDYLRGWSSWDGASDGMRWPVKSGQREDISVEAVRDFFTCCLDPRDIGETGFTARLKEERVRWHPDKMQQKSGNSLDEPTMKHVTAVFQIVDQLWADFRSKARQ